MFTEKFIKIFHSVQEIGLFSLFQNLNLGNASANPKRHLTISCATSCQYQCVCKMLSKYSKRFKSYRHFSRTGRGQNLHKLSGDKIKCLIIGHSVKFNFKFQLTVLGSCNCGRSLEGCWRYMVENRYISLLNESILKVMRRRFNIKSLFLISQIRFFDITNSILWYQKIICDIKKYFVISKKSILWYYKICDIKKKNRICDITKLIYWYQKKSFW